MARIDSFLYLVAEQHASDLHFHAGNPPIIRHDGDLVALPFRSLSEEESLRFILEMMTPDQRVVFERDGEIDFAYVLEGVARFRANVFRQSQGVGGVFRVIPSRVPTFDDLSLPAGVRSLAGLPNGLVLVTGPTGSGKSTTLAAMVLEINRTQKKHIITIEDPIEYIHTPIQSMVSQRQVGKHTDSFHSALRSSLRESPDVLVVGEMRDFETVSLGISAAETGVLVFGTLHTNSAPKAVDRLVDVCPEELHEQMRGVLSMLLRGVVSQHLAKRADGDGRIAVIEVLLQTYAVSNMIRENKTFQIESYLQQGDQNMPGMQSLDACILKYVREGLIVPDEALRLSNHPDQLLRLIAEFSEDA